MTDGQQQTIITAATTTTATTIITEHHWMLLRMTIIIIIIMYGKKAIKKKIVGLWWKWRKRWNTHPILCIIYICNYILPIGRTSHSSPEQLMIEEKKSFLFCYGSCKLWIIEFIAWASLITIIMFDGNEKLRKFSNFLFENKFVSISFVDFILFFSRFFF